ncbi:MAG: 4Fe-4S dicluster domain-containing protein [Chloroflexota bacterium]|nr:MAG: 4Fe-4S dicluster domain-containing protein [Chloroflexota bacterium]
MKHNIPVQDYGQLASEMADAVSQCVHCGFCLPACPTYNLLHQEMDSPRGRIILMKSVLEREIDLEEAVPYIDHCLGCLACQTVCPSGVQYGNLLTPFKAYSETVRRRPAEERFSRWVTKETLPKPARFRLATQVAKISKPFASIAPTRFQAMLDLVPEDIPGAERLPSTFPAQGKRQAKVALQVGCVQQVLAQKINLATLRVLSKNGIEVVIPSAQGCCGALALHTGDMDTAFNLASNNLDNFPKDVDAIISNAAGCGSAMHEYPQLFKGSKYEELASLFAEKVIDISVFLTEIDLEPIPPLENQLKIAYHDACHLSHAQGVTREPRELLGKVPNLSLLPINEEDLCCGSAGSYNLEQPVIAQQLGQRKIHNILDVEPEIIVTGNIGCLIQLQNHLNQKLQNTDEPQLNPPVMHTIELIDQAYRNEL